MIDYLDMQIEAQIDNNFTYHPPTASQRERYENIRSQACEFARSICEMVPPSRERSLFLTNLEQAVMWANAGIARNE